MDNRIGKRSPMRHLHKTRAIEPVIAALLLIAIAVAASVVTYSWVMGMISSQQAQAGTGIRIDLIEFKVGKTLSILTSTTTLKTDLVLGADSNNIKADSTIMRGSVLAVGSKIPGGSTFPTGATVPTGTTSGTAAALTVDVLSVDVTLTAAYTVGGSSGVLTIKLTGGTASSNFTAATITSGSTIKATSTIASGSSVTSDRIEITIRNSGSVIGIIATIYVKTPEGDQWKQDWTSENMITPAQTKKFVFTTLNTDYLTGSGSTGATVGDLKEIPFGWVTSSSYTIRIITDNGFVSELAQTSPSTHA